MEGIFGKEILKFVVNYNCILINLETNKNSCMKRVIKRDYLERGKNKNIAKKDFIKAWELYYKNKNKNKSRNYIQKITIRNKGDIKDLLNKITNIVN